MPSPFPGMNPYLEHPEVWPEVHHRLITAIADILNPLVLPKYRVAIEKRVYELGGEKSVLVGIPDVIVHRQRTQTNPTSSNVAVVAPPATPVTVTVPMPEEVREGYLEVRELATGEVVTAIEVLSPTNKRPGKGRQVYEEKRQQVLGSRTHFVEIDLLRGGEPLPVFGNEIEASYRILVSRGNCRPVADLYLFNLQNIIPSFPLPLRSGDVEPALDLQTVLNSVYERAAYDYIIDYNAEPALPLSESDAAWADTLLREKQCRQ
ncbi:MAG: DUF4058 family protein [Microcoleus vaginatus WJT46-NPBG5]|jgi:hypothetical protein|nr:DUF4058 family protein [Microcoleus vaginatus WJT46-NPBG5]